MNKNHNSQAKPIGIFDSGVGGLTVVKEMIKSLPEEVLCYFGDTAHTPYGTKSAETVQRYCVEITRFLRSHDAKMIVVACNTASSVALEQIHKNFDGPVIGVVEPGVRAAREATQNGRVGVIGTKSTIQSGTYQQRLLRADPSLHVVAQACPLFVALAEEGWEDDPVTLEVAKRYLQPLIKEKVDVIILGCTHFPLLEKAIEHTMGKEVRLVNSAKVVTQEVKQVMKNYGIENSRREYKNLFYASDDIEGFQRLYQRFCGKTNDTFYEAASDYFSIVQEVHRFKGKIFADTIQWFDPLEKS